MFLPNPGVLAAGVGGGKTYTQFLAHIETLAGGATRDWVDSSSTWSLSGGAVVVTAGPAGGNLYGSSWEAPFWGAVAGAPAACRVVQHGLPSSEAFNEQVSGGLKVLVRATSASAPSGYSSKTRNDYTSLSSATTTGARFCTEILAWIDGRPMRMQPHLGLGPEPYDWEG